MLSWCLFSAYSIFNLHPSSIVHLTIKEVEMQLMSYRIVAVFAAVASAGLLSVTMWPGALAEIIVMLVVLGFLLSVALSFNLVSRILTNGPPDQLIVEWFLRGTV